MAKTSIKINDTPGVSYGGRVDDYWKMNGIKKRYLAFRNPTPVIPKEFTGDDYLNQNKILNKYKIKGFEYGKWTSNEDRFNFLIGFIVSLEDLHKVLGIANIGMNKTIGVAYGARGKGGRAAAHFEPHTFMINLTKPHGMGTFAHEYGHALDYFFGTFIDQDKDNRSLSLGTSIATRFNVSDYKVGSLRYLMAKVMDAVIYKSKGEKSAFYKKLYDEATSPYWLQHNEMFARAFEQYVSYNLSKANIKNVLLNRYKYDRWMYMQDADLKRVIPHMERLIKMMASKAI